VSYRTYPHIDGYERAVQAAALVQEAMEGRKKPRCLLLQPAMLEGAEHGRTTQPGLMLDLLAKADTFEKEPGIDVVSIQAGFTWADIPYTGPSVAVSYEPPAESRARALARELIDEIWRRRDEGAATYYRPIADGIAAARALSDGGAVGKQGPLVIADGTDNPGGGGYNDTTPVLKALLDAGIENVAFGTIYDPAAVQQATRAGVGSEIEVSLGGHTDAAMGAPVKAKAIVKMLSDGSFRNDGPMNAGVETSMGPTAVLRIGAVASSRGAFRGHCPGRDSGDARRAIRRRRRHDRVEQNRARVGSYRTGAPRKAGAYRASPALGLPGRLGRR
jgi:microcystin degradation protein MlrC